MGHPLGVVAGAYTLYNRGAMSWRVATRAMLFVTCLLIVNTIATELITTIPTIAVAEARQAGVDSSRAGRACSSWR